MLTIGYDTDTLDFSETAVKKAVNVFSSGDQIILEYQINKYPARGVGLALIYQVMGEDYLKAIYDPLDFCFTNSLEEIHDRFQTCKVKGWCQTHSRRKVNLLVLIQMCRIKHIWDNTYRGRHHPTFNNAVSKIRSLRDHELLTEEEVNLLKDNFKDYHDRTYVSGIYIPKTLSITRLSFVA